jgi:rfaE bifunctional protein kinase chain/domain
MFKSSKILVIGDIILDTYVYGAATRLSQEAPVPVVLVDRKETSLGGAANVCANLRSLGAKVYACGAVGQDLFGDEVFTIMRDIGIHSEAVIRIDGMPTIVKTRVISNGQHVVRYDLEKYINESDSDKLIEALSFLDINFDAVVVSDYNKGTISKKIMDFVKSSYRCPVFADPKPTNKELYYGVHCITPNLYELMRMSNAIDITEAARQLKQELALNCIVVTLSEKGVMLLDENNVCHCFDAHKLSWASTKHSKSDVTGAGDTLISAFVLSICSGFDYLRSLRIANIAAAIVVNQLGTVTCQIKELENEIQNLENGSQTLLS